MYADRYTKSRGLNPGGLAFALGASGVLLFGLSLSAPHFIETIDRPLEITNIPIDPPPPLPEPKLQPKVQPQKPVVAQPIERVDHTRPVADPVPSMTFANVPIALDAPGGVTVGTADVPATIQPHAPVLRDPTLDTRYLDRFQPAYPSDERLAGREGRVVVRVLIGTDGRVKDVQQISAATTAFFEATRKQALSAWRFKPGTKDGVAVETWHTMAVRFVLDL